MLHIVNGGSTEQTLGQTSLVGECFSFQDVLITGPAPKNVSGAEWRRIRAEHLSKSYSVDLLKVQEGLAEQERVCESFSEHDEVVLWFEHDLFCQLNLLYLLDWFSRARLGSTRLSLVNIGEFPGRPNFRGLGELNANELGSLFDTRTAVTRDQLDLSAAVWNAYRSPDPQDIGRLVDTSISAQSFLKTALLAHLRRFPSTHNGLGRIENRCLELIESGCHNFSAIFAKFCELEGIYGFGDAQLWLSLVQLSKGEAPPLVNADEQISPQMNHQALFTLTDAGEQILNNQADFVELNGIDMWLGGVHLNSRSGVWRWDEPANKLSPPING